MQGTLRRMRLKDVDDTEIARDGCRSCAGSEPDSNAQDGKALGRFMHIHIPGGCDTAVIVDNCNSRRITPTLSAGRDFPKKYLMFTDKARNNHNHCTRRTGNKHTIVKNYIYCGACWTITLPVPKFRSLYKNVLNVPP